MTLNTEYNPVLVVTHMDRMISSQREKYIQLLTGALNVALGNAFVMYINQENREMRSFNEDLLVLEILHQTLLMARQYKLRSNGNF